MSPKELAVLQTYEFWNVVEHATRVAEDARRAIARDDLPGAATLLKQVSKNLDLRLTDARHAVEQAQPRGPT